MASSGHITGGEITSGGGEAPIICLDCSNRWARVETEDILCRIKTDCGAKDNWNIHTGWHCTVSTEWIWGLMASKKYEVSINDLNVHYGNTLHSFNGILFLIKKIQTRERKQGTVKRRWRTKLLRKLKLVVLLSYFKYISVVSPRTKILIWLNNN